MFSKGKATKSAKATGMCEKGEKQTRPQLQQPMPEPRLQAEKEINGVEIQCTTKAIKDAEIAAHD